MSGINEIKKKAKLSINEMYEDQLVGKMDNQEEIKLERKQTIQPEKQQQVYLNQEELKFTPNLNTSESSLQPTQTLPPKQCLPSFLSFKQPTKKLATYKMTFNLTEEIYKSFNDLYANRMLKGQKTEKSELICEAIEWLIKMEESST